MDFIRCNIDEITRLNWMLFIAFEHNSLAFEHKHLMFVGVAVFRCVAIRLNGTLAHGKIRSAICIVDQPTDTTALGPLHLDFCRFDLI